MNGCDIDGVACKCRPNSGIDLAQVLLDLNNRISEKPREPGRRWVRQEIARAREKGKGVQSTPPQKRASGSDGVTDHD
jgi:hypothetical protein